MQVTSAEVLSANANSSPYAQLGASRQASSVCEFGEFPFSGI